MGLSLSEIEEKATEIAERLLEAGKAEALLLGIQIEGLRDLAQIKAVADQRAQWNVSIGLRTREVATAEAMRERELAAMQTAADAQSELVSQRAPKPTVCGDEAPMGREFGVGIFCQLPAGHLGSHVEVDSVGSRAVWPAGLSGRCGSVGPDWLVCEYQTGHVGPHGRGNGYWNGEGVDAVPGLPAMCHHRWTWESGDAPGHQDPVRHFEICTLLPGHAGDHLNNVTGTRMPVEEPTKPAADRLHELVGYLVQTSNEQYRLSVDQLNGDQATSVKHMAASKAYDDAGQKLQEILQEGGI